MRLTNTLAGTMLAVAALATSALGQADQSAIRWLGEISAADLPVGPVVEQASLTEAAPAEAEPMPTPLPPQPAAPKMEPAAPKAQPKPQPAAPAVEVAPEPTKAQAKAEPAAEVKPAVADQPVVTAEAKTVVQSVATVQPVAKKAPSAGKTDVAGGRWTVSSSPSNVGRQNLLANVLSDPFADRRPPEWSPLYRAGGEPGRVRLMDNPGANPVNATPSDIVPAGFAAAGCGDAGCSTGCSTGACGSDCCSSGCGGGCCGGGCCCGPTWSAGVDALFFWRSSPDSNTPLVACNCVDNHIDFQATDFDLGVAAAPRIRLFRHDPCCCDFEVMYFNFDNWDEYRHFYGDLTVLGNNLGAGTTAAAQYESSLQSLEVNLLKSHGCWTKLLAGFRWLQLDEYASVYGSNGSTTVFQNNNTLNNLYGGHIGFRRLLYDYGGCLTVDGSVKTGVFGNDAERNTYGYGTQHLNKGGVSFVGDVEFQANFAVTCRCAITAGYQLLWITGLASAPEQFHAYDYINNGETIFFHGANVGAVYTW
ncbi:MAG: hypothetical protein AAGJ46_20340 [Planctomycetota bacterium]